MSWSAQEIEHFLRETVIPVRLSFLTESGAPAVASHWYLFDQGFLWCAVQESSFVAKRLAADGRCGFEVAGDQPPYRGVRGRGRAHLEPAKGDHVLRRLISRYLGESSPALRDYLLSRSGSETALRIETEHWSSWDYSRRMD